MDFNCYAECPSHDLEDMQALFHEKKMQPKAAREFLNMIPDRLLCISSGLLRSATDDEIYHLSQQNDGRSKSYGVYMINDLTAFDEPPKFEWDQIFNFVKKD